MNYLKKVSRFIGFGILIFCTSGMKNPYAGKHLSDSHQAYVSFKLKGKKYSFDLSSRRTLLQAGVYNKRLDQMRLNVDSKAGNDTLFLTILVEGKQGLYRFSPNNALSLQINSELYLSNHLEDSTFHPHGKITITTFEKEGGKIIETFSGQVAHLNKGQYRSTETITDGKFQLSHRVYQQDF